MRFTLPNDGPSSRGGPPIIPMNRGTAARGMPAEEEGYEMTLERWFENAVVYCLDVETFQRQ